MLPIVFIAYCEKLSIEILFYFLETIKYWTWGQLIGHSKGRILTLISWHQIRVFCHFLWREPAILLQTPPYTYLPLAPVTLVFKPSFFRPWQRGTWTPWDLNKCSSVTADLSKTILSARYSCTGKHSALIQFTTTDLEIYEGYENIRGSSKYLLNLPRNSLNIPWWIYTIGFFRCSCSACLSISSKNLKYTLTFSKRTLNFGKKKCRRVVFFSSFRRQSQFWTIFGGDGNSLNLGPETSAKDCI